MRFSQEIQEKVFNIAKLTFSIAVLVKRQKFKEFLENTAIDFVGYFDDKAISYIDNVLKFGEVIGELPLGKIADLYAGINDLKDCIRQDIDLSAELNDFETIVESLPLEPAFLTELTRNGELDTDKAITNVNKQNLFLDKANNQVKTSISRLLLLQIRQSTIMNKAKDIGRCQLKDFMEILPNVSERTLRYDLHKLCEQGVLERVGGSGVSSFYQLKSPT